MKHHGKKPQVHKYRNSKIYQKKAPIPFNISEMTDAATIDYNSDTEIGKFSKIKTLSKAC